MPRWTKQQQETIDYFGDEATVAFCAEGHSGPGWYVWSTECSQEGSVFLGLHKPKQRSCIMCGRLARALNPATLWRGPRSTPRLCKPPPPGSYFCTLACAAFWGISMAAAARREPGRKAP